MKAKDRNVRREPNPLRQEKYQRALPLAAKSKLHKDSQGQPETEGTTSGAATPLHRSQR